MSDILNHKIYGDGEPLIILHGLFGMLDNWQSIARKLQEDYKVILVDQRNHGRSKRSDRFSYEEMAADIIELMDFLALESSSILGHSMGGKTAIQVANRYPNRIQKLISVDIVPRPYKRGHDEIFKAIQLLPINEIASRKQAEEYLSPQIKNIGVRQFLLKNLHRKTDGGFEWKANFEVLYRDYENIIGAIEINQPIDIPTLFVRGTKSNYITDEDLSELDEIFRNYQCVDLVAGHWIHAEKPAELLDALRTFLTS